MNTKCFICGEESTIDPTTLSETHLVIDNELYYPLGHKDDYCQEIFKSSAHVPDSKCSICSRYIMKTYEIEGKTALNLDIYYTSQAIYCSPICYYNKNIYDKKETESIS